MSVARVSLNNKAIQLNETYAYKFLLWINKFDSSVCHVIVLWTYLFALVFWSSKNIHFVFVHWIICPFSSLCQLQSIQSIVCIVFVQNENSTQLKVDIWVRQKTTADSQFAVVFWKPTHTQNMWLGANHSMKQHFNGVSMKFNLSTVSHRFPEQIKPPFYLSLVDVVFFVLFIHKYISWSGIYGFYR